MVFQLVVRLMLLLSLLLWLTLTVASSALSSVAKPGCQYKCGNVTIRFPFGIGAGCAANDNFAITCENSSKPFFTSNNLQVLHFLYAYVEVLLPVLAYDCPDGRTDRQLVNLSPNFVVSESFNVFTATGCNNLALMRNQGSKIVGGCSSICRDDNSDDGGGSSCYGINCCQTSIPPSLNFINTSLSTINNDSKTNHDCNYAFIVRQSWFDSLLNTDPNYDMQKIQRVPVWLEWGMLGECNRSALCGPNAYCSPITNFTYKCVCNFSYEANPYLSHGCPGSGMGRKKIIIIGVSSGIIGILLLLGGTWWLYKFVKRRKKLMLKQKFFKRNGGLLLQQQLSSGDEGNVEKTKLFTLKELEKATDHFNENRILGQGGQGTVYKGMLIDGRIVAIKKSKIVDEGNLEQFINEVVILSQINHRNVVKLHGCCLEAEVPMLVYEFIPNGNLYQYIHEQNEEFPLTWDIRVRVATEVAGAVSYLHSAASMPIYHRDIKSTNILLDEKFKAKVSDFGTSKSVSIDQTHMTTLVQGTFGYLDPEYFQSSQFTEKSDVYSFGVVLVELLTGKKPISTIISEECRSLATYFILTMKENRLFDILDARVSTEGEKDEIMRVANIAKRCLSLSGRKRPTMKEVAIELEGIRMSYGVSIVQQNCEEEEYAINELTGFWDAASTSTGSCLDSNVSSSLDVQALLFK